MATERHAAFQVADCTVRSEMVRRLQDHPGLGMVGLPCYSVNKIGSAAGEIVENRLGIIATGTAEAIRRDAVARPVRHYSSLGEQVTSPQANDKGCLDDHG